MVSQGWRQETDNLIQTGIARVLQNFQRGDHLQATVTLDHLDYHDDSNTVTPTLAIESGAILQVRTSGAKISKGKLRQLVPVYQERTVDRSLLVEGRRNLIEYFQSQGYFDAQVDFGETTPEPGRQVVEFEITPQERHKLVKIDISGNQFLRHAHVTRAADH